MAGPKGVRPKVELAEFYLVGGYTPPPSRSLRKDKVEEPHDDGPVEPQKVVSRLHATFDVVDAWDTEQNKPVSLTYEVTGKLVRIGNELRLKRTRALVLANDDDTFEPDYRFRPGLESTLTATRLLAKRLHEEFPEATSLEIHGKRATEGFPEDRKRREVYRFKLR